MLGFLRATNLGSPRKLRLFAVACCRHIWHKLLAAWFDADRAADEAGQSIAASKAAAWSVRMNVKEGASQAAALAVQAVGVARKERPPIAPLLLVWSDCIVVRLAQAAYEERLLPKGTLDPCRLGVLADALEDAGCTNY
jgi:hypothetical protein